MIARKALAAEYLCCPSCKHDLDWGSESATCSNCRAQYPTVEDVLVALPQVSGSIDERLRWRYEATRGGTSLPSVFPVTQRMLGDLRGLAVLDVGCSQGQFALSHLMSAGARVVIGVDFSVGAVQAAQRAAAGLPNVLFVAGDAMALPLKDGRFDRVVITEVIEHLPDVQKCLSELRRVLADDGEIVLSTPNYFNPVGVFKRIFDRVHHHGRERWTYADHSEELERFQTPFSVQRDFAKADLEVLDFRGSDIWMAIRKAILVPWLLFDQLVRRLTTHLTFEPLTRSFLKYFGVVQYYRLHKQQRPGERHD